MTRASTTQTPSTPNGNPSVAFMTIEPTEQALIDAGIADENTSRVVIDIQVGHLPKVYIERFGDDKLLEVVKTLDGMKIVREDRPPHRQPCLSQPPAPQEHHGLVFHVHHCMHDATDTLVTALEHQCRCGKTWTTEPSEEIAV